MSLDYTIPESVSDETASKINAALERVADLMIEDRQYSLNISDFQDEEKVYSQDGLHYVVQGEKPLAESVSVEIDDEGPLAQGDEFVRIGVKWSGRIMQYKQRNWAALVYDAMAQEGISRPRDNRDVGVQIRPDQQLVVIENVTKA